MIILNQNTNIRRIDELGRIVIPKDIRKKLHLSDNEPLEVFIKNDEIILKKYNVLPDIDTYLRYLVDIGNRITGNQYIITDKEKVLASSSKELNNLTVSTEIEEIIRTGKRITDEYIKIEIANNSYIEGYINEIVLLIDDDKSGIILEINKTNKLNNDHTIRLLKEIIEKELSNYWPKWFVVIYLRHIERGRKE